MSTAPTPSPAPSELQDILESIVTVGIGAASIFIKNPKSQQNAANVINVVQSILPAIEDVVSKL